MRKEAICLEGKIIPVYVEDKYANDILKVNDITNRLLPEGFSCAMLSDGKTLGIFRPKEKEVMIEDVKYLYPQNK